MSDRALEKIHRDRPFWPYLVGVVGLAAVGVGVYGMQYEMARHSEFHDGFGADFQAAAGIGGFGLLLLGLTVFRLLRTLRIDFDRGAMALVVIPRGEPRFSQPLSEIRTLAIVPIRKFVFDRNTFGLMRVDRDDLLCAATTQGTREFARGSFERMKVLGTRLAGLPGAGFPAPTAATEPLRALSADVKGRLERALETTVVDEWKREIQQVLDGAQGGVDDAARLLAEDALRRHERRHAPR